MNFSLSFDEGQRLAIIKGGKFNGETIYLKKNAKKDEILKHVKLPSGKLEQMPTNIKDSTDVNFYTGARGAGKSETMSKFIKNYMLEYPENKIFMFSEGEDDKNLDNLVDKWFVIREPTEKQEEELKENTIKLIKLDEGKYLFPPKGIPYDMFNQPCLCIFDDIDELEDTKTYKAYTNIYGLMGKLINVGRKKGITVCNTAHFTTDQHKTKKILGGCSSFTWFPHNWTEQIDNALRGKFGISKEKIKELKELKNTWSITLFRTCPPVIMTDKEIFIL